MTNTVETYEIRGRKFRTKADYARGFRDNQTIERIERDLDKTDPDAVAALRIELERGKYHFETLLGDDYLEEIVELDEELKKNQPMAEEPKKRGLSYRGRRTSNASSSEGSIRNAKGKKRKELSDYDEKNAFDIESFLSTRLRMKKDQEVELHEMGVIEDDAKDN